MTKKALMVVSFGTTYRAAQQAIEKIEERLQKAMPDYDFYRAFTSGMVIRKLMKTENMKIDTPQELVEKLHQAGYQQVVCQSLHVINGVEYEKLCQQLAPYADKFDSIQLGKPLLTHAADYALCGEIVMQQIPTLREHEAFVMMGHGTEHFSNASYCQLENTLRFQGYEHVYVGTVEGFPDLDYVLARLAKKDIRKVYLMPFMIVAGDHAQNDLAGDEADSWKSILSSAGYAVELILRGLGEDDRIADIFEDHLTKSKKI